MSEDEYKAAIKKIEDDRETAIYKLYKDYAKSQERFKIGDMVFESRWTFVIDKITAHKSFGFPAPVYHGYELKKDGTRKKNNNRVATYGNEGLTLVDNATNNKR